MDKKTFGQIALEAMRRGTKDSGDRNDRYDKIYDIEMTKWPHGMGSKQRTEIPENQQAELDACITKSQEIAREACQTPELTEAYLKSNSA